MSTSPTERVIIVGAGQAGARAAEALRAAGFAGEVVLIGEERHEPYERPRLSKSVLTGEEPAAAAAVHPSHWYAAQGIALRTRTRVEAIAPRSQAIITADGQRLEYSMLLLCTGSRVRPLTGAPEGLRGVHYLRTVEDSERLAEELVPGRRLVVIGGGFIGLEVASSALKRGLDVTVVEREPALLERVLPAPIAAKVAALHAASGVKTRLGAAVSHIHGNGAVKNVQLADGGELPAELVVIGVGIIPNTELAETAGAASSDGVVVDEYCRTTLENVYAAGDVTNHYNSILERRVRLESWQNAQNQAIAAARNIAGAGQRYAEVPWFWSDQLDTNLQMVGVAQPGMEIVWRGERLAFGLIDGRMRLAVGFDAGGEIRAARRLIESRTPLCRQAPCRPRPQAQGPSHGGDMFSVNTVIDQPGHLRQGAARRRGPVQMARGRPAVRSRTGSTPARTIYQREVERIFHGPTWNFVALEAEMPNPGDYKRSYVGPTPVVVARDTDGSMHVFENRCTHRGAEFCREQRGNTKEFVCPYHQWTYDLKGNLQGVPFKRGLKGEGGGMPKDFKNEDHGLTQAQGDDAPRRGVRLLSRRLEPLEDYLGPEILEDFEVVFKGRKLKILGYYRNELPGNWKLYHENLKDPYHATLLHSFLVTFGLMVAGSKNAMITDPSGRHGTMASAKPDNVAAVVDATPKKEMRAFREDFKLADGALPRLRARVRLALVGHDADDLAEPDRAARAEHARHSPHRAERPAQHDHAVDDVRLRGRRRGDDAPPPAPGQPDGAVGLPRARGQRGDQVRAGRACAARRPSAACSSSAATARHHRLADRRVGDPRACTRHYREVMGL